MIEQTKELPKLRIKDGEVQMMVEYEGVTKWFQVIKVIDGDGPMYFKSIRKALDYIEAMEPLTVPGAAYWLAQDFDFEEACEGVFEGNFHARYRLNPDGTWEEVTDGHNGLVSVIVISFDTVLAVHFFNMGFVTHERTVTSRIFEIDDLILNLIQEMDVRKKA